MADITYSSVDSEVSDILNKYYVSNIRSGYIKANDVVLPVYFKKFAQRIQDMDIRDDDVWLCGYPKTGTTWCQEMTWCIANDLDFEGAKQSLPDRFPFLELILIFDFENMNSENPEVKLPSSCGSDSIEFINGLKSPRFIKSHLPYKLLPKKLRDQSTKAKIVYVSRNAKDTCLSYFHYSCLMDGYRGNFEDFCKLFAADSLCFSPFFDHILGYWNRRNDSQVLFLKYEDMKQDLRAVIRRTAQFLGKDLTDDQMLLLEDHLSFESMKRNKAVNYEPYIVNNEANARGSFMRSGIVGEGKQKMSPEYVKIFDEWEKKCLGNSGLKF